LEFDSAAAGDVMNIIIGNSDILFKVIPDHNASSIDSGTPDFAVIDGNAIHGTLGKDGTHSRRIFQAEIVDVQAIVIGGSPDSSFGSVVSKSILYFKIFEGNISDTVQNPNPEV